MEHEDFQETLNKRLEVQNLSMVTIEVCPEKNGTIEVSSVNTSDGNRGKGFGRKAMAVLTDLADERAVKLSLEIAGDEEEDEDYSPDGLPGFWVLKDFYESCGFDYIGNENMIYRPTKK